MKFSGLKPHWQRARQSAVFYGVFATAVRVGANLFLLPLLLGRMSTAELALWYIFLALGSFANLADFGFGQSISRVYSYLWAGAEDFDAEGLRAPPTNREPNRPRIRQLTATVHFFYWRLSVAATLVLAVVGTVVLMKPTAAVAEPRLAWIAWAGYLLTIGFNLATGWWMLACQGIGRVRELQAAYTWSGLAYVACAAALLSNGWGLLAVVVASALRGVLTRQYCRRVYYAAVPRIATQTEPQSRDILKRLWPNASKFGMISLGAFFLTNGTVLISSNFLDSSITASFGVTAQIGAFLANFATLWLSVKWPYLTMLRTQGRLVEMSVLFARRLAFSLGTFIILAAFVVLVGNPLLAWKGTHTRLLATPALIFYFVYLAQQIFYGQFGSLAFTENVVPFFKIALFTGLWMLALSMVMTWTFGFWGMLAAPLLAETTYSSWYTVKRGFSGQPLTLRQFLRAALSGKAAG
jgi:O-antigen/teichoic acid export membrane protein